MSDEEKEIYAKGISDKMQACFQGKGDGTSSPLPEWLHLFADSKEMGVHWIDGKGQFRCFFFPIQREQ